MSSIKRSILRSVAKDTMRKEGKRQFCKHYISSFKDPRTGFVSSTKIPSFFAENWREYAHYGEE